MSLTWCSVEDATYPHTSRSLAVSYRHLTPSSRTKACPEFGSLSCPRCLEWSHWEESCWTIEPGQTHVCTRSGADRIILLAYQGNHHL